MRHSKKKCLVLSIAFGMCVPLWVVTFIRWDYSVLALLCAIMFAVDSIAWAYQYRKTCILEQEAKAI